MTASAGRAGFSRSSKSRLPPLGQAFNELVFRRRICQPLLFLAIGLGELGWAAWQIYSALHAG
jgi:hypothetical protein